MKAPAQHEMNVVNCACWDAYAYSLTNANKEPQFAPVILGETGIPGGKYPTPTTQIATTLDGARVKFHDPAVALEALKTLCR